MRGGGFGRDAGPELVVFGEVGLEGVGGEGGVDVGFVGAVVAGVFGDSFAEFGFDGGHEGVLFREGDAGEGEVGSRETAVERADIVGLGGLDLLVGDEVGPEGVGDEGLVDAVDC